MLNRTPKLEVHKLQYKSNPDALNLRILPFKANKYIDKVPGHVMVGVLFLYKHQKVHLSLRIC